MLMILAPYLKNEWPPYASCIQIELYSDSQDDYFVKVLYQGEELTLSDEFDDNMIPLEYFPCLGNTKDRDFS